MLSERCLQTIKPDSAQTLTIASVCSKRDLNVQNYRSLLVTIGHSLRICAFSPSKAIAALSCFYFNKSILCEQNIYKENLGAFAICILLQLLT